jgi:hypothetical protein
MIPTLKPLGVSPLVFGFSVPVVLLYEGGPANDGQS